jgi:hypothetical protein
LNDLLDKSKQKSEQPPGGEDTPRFGRLLIVLAIAVLLIAAITFGTEAFYS